MFENSVFPIKTSRILFRITLPFTLLFASVTILTWAASTLLIGHFLDQGLRMQLVRIANGISQSSFLLNPRVLNQIKGMVDADIVMFDATGQVLSSTVDAGWVKQPSLAELLAHRLDRQDGREVSVNGEPYRVAVQEVTLPSGRVSYLSLWQRTAVTAHLKYSIVLITAGISLGGIIALALAGYGIARSISTPVAQMARITDKIAAGDFSSRAQIEGGDEIAQLGRSFNVMIDRLRESERKLVETGKLAVAGQLAAGVAHEIKNPLTAIKMFVQVLQRRLTADPKNVETLGAVLSEINRLDRIVDQIVQRARPEDGVRLELTRPDELVAEVLQLSRDSLNAANISVRAEFADTLPMLALDREKIKQVLWNIVVNAKDAMPRGGALTVTLRYHPDSELVELIFEDTGSGLPAGVQPEDCFDSFFTTKPEGLGLGLTMSRKIVARHHGRLTLTPRSDGGMRVAVALPCRADSNGLVSSCLAGGSADANS